MADVVLFFVVIMVLLSPLFLGMGLLAFVNTRVARKMDPAARARWHAEVMASKTRLNRQRIANQNNPYSGWYQGR